MDAAGLAMLPDATLPASCQRILVTGAEGFVGHHLTSFLAEIAAPDAVVLRAGRAADSDVLLDLSDPESVSAAITQARPDVVFHLAGEASVAAAGTAAARTWHVNVGGSLALAEALARSSPNATLLFASSSEIYGRAFLNGAVTEASCPWPISVYAQSKLAAEQVLATVLPPTATLVVARPSNHLGPGQSPQFALPSFAAQLAEAERAGAPAHIKVGNLAAERDFMDVRDVVRAYALLVRRFHGSGARETVNIASGEVRSIATLLEALRAAAKVASQVMIDPERMRAADIPTARIQASRLREETGWTPHHSLEQTVISVLDDWRARLGS